MSALTEGGYVTLGQRFVLASAPGSGATVTLWSSVSNNGAIGHGARLKGIYINIYSSHASAANGLTVEESNDGGTTWDAVAAGTTVNATTYTKTYIKVSAPEVRVRYVNSASVITTWRGSVMGDPNERGNG